MPEKVLSYLSTWVDDQKSKEWLASFDFLLCSDASLSRWPQTSQIRLWKTGQPSEISDFWSLFPWTNQILIHESKPNQIVKNDVRQYSNF